MATTNISTEIVSITGVTAHGASDEFIVSAQKFVAASIPKDLLRWAASETVPATHGGDDSPTRYIIDDEECVANSEKGSIANLKSHLEEESDSKKKSALKALKKPVLNYKDGVVCEISADES